MKSRVVLMYARPYRMLNNATGQLEREGISIQYYGDDNLRPIIRNEESGRRVVENSLPYEVLSHIEEVPGIYDVEFEEGSVRRNGKLESKLVGVDLKFVEPVYPVTVTRSPGQKQEKPDGQ